VGWLSLGSFAHPGLQLITSAIRTLAREWLELPLRAHSAPERCLGFVEAVGHPLFGPCTMRSALGGGKMIQFKYTLVYFFQRQSPFRVLAFLIGAPPGPPLTRRSDRNPPAQKSGRVRFSGPCDHYPPVSRARSAALASSRLSATPPLGPGAWRAISPRALLRLLLARTPVSTQSQG
jgi:hypothetical protein